jgi:hypothetical protein
LGEHPLALRRQGDEHPAPVLDAPLPAHEAAHFEPVEQFNGAVVPELQAFRQVADGHFLAGCGALRCKQKLMLLRLQAGLPRGVFAEAQEEPELVAELR